MRVRRRRVVQVNDFTRVQDMLERVKKSVCTAVSTLDTKESDSIWNGTENLLFYLHWRAMRHGWDYGCHFVCLAHSVRLQFNANGIFGNKIELQHILNIITCSHPNTLYCRCDITFSLSSFSWIRWHPGNTVPACVCETNDTFYHAWRPTRAHKLEQPQELRNRPNCFLSIPGRFQAPNEIEQLPT